MMANSNSDSPSLDTYDGELGQLSQAPSSQAACSSTTTPVQCSGRLLTLPLELLLLITEFLERHEAVLLSLSRHKLRSTFGHAAIESPSWLTLDRSQQAALHQQRRKFLHFLVVGHPWYFACSDCNALHKTADVLLPGRNSKRLEASPHTELRCGTGFKGSWYILHSPREQDTFYRLTPQHLRLAMDRYHHGAPYGLGLDSLSYAQVTRPARFSLPTALYVIPRIVSGKIYLRSQIWILRDDVSWDKFEDCERYLFICEHMPAKFFNALLLCKFENQHGDPPCPTCPTFLCCVRCGVEFRVREDRPQPPYQDRLRPVRALVVDIWRDLGHGEDDWDPSWYSHMRDEYLPFLRFQLPRCVRGADPFGGCRAIFESQEGKSCEATAEELRPMIYDHDFLSRTHRFDNLGTKILNMFRFASGMKQRPQPVTCGLFKLNLTRSQTFVTKYHNWLIYRTEHWERHGMEDVDHSVDDVHTHLM